MLNRLIPATHATASVAAVAHVASLTYVTKSIGLEGIGIAVLTYILTFLAAIPFGTVLLLLISHFKIGLMLSLVLFLTAAPLAVIAVSTLLFGFEPGTIPLEYAYMAIPSVIAAWYGSIYHEWKKNRDGTDI